MVLKVKLLTSAFIIFLSVDDCESGWLLTNSADVDSTASAILLKKSADLRTRDLSISEKIFRLFQKWHFWRKFDHFNLFSIFEIFFISLNNLLNKTLMLVSDNL